MLYDAILASWREKKINTAADVALEMNGNGAAFIYHSAKIENDSITYHDTREIFDHGGVTSYTGDVRSLFEIQNSVAAYYRMLDAFEKREPMSEALICEFQGLLTQGTYDTLCYQKGERPGAYKKHDYVTGAKEVGALPEDVPDELADLLAELEDIEPSQALTAAAYFHAKWERTDWQATDELPPAALGSSARHHPRGRSQRVFSQEVNRMYQEIGYSQFQRENAVLIELSTSLDTG